MLPSLRAASEGFALESVFNNYTFRNRKGKSVNRSINLILATCLAVVIAMTLSACTSSQNEKSLTVEDIKSRDAVFCLKEGGVIIESGAVELLHNSNVCDIYSGAEPLTIDRSRGDKLILVGAAGNSHNVNSSTGTLVNIEGGVNKYYWTGEKVDTDTLAKFNGENIEDTIKENWNKSGASAVTNAMNTDGFEYLSLGNGDGAIVSKEPTEYSFGYYDDTKLVEEELFTNVPVYESVTIMNDKPELNVEKGEEGYFTVNVDNLDPGIYVIFLLQAEASGYVIEIV